MKSYKKVMKSYEKLRKVMKSYEKLWTAAKTASAETTPNTNASPSSVFLSQESVFPPINLATKNCA
jgi:hypothetical protein